MSENYRLLVSTFRRLLRVTLDARFGLLAVDVVDDGRGTYFGLTGNGSRVFAVARNLDTFLSVQDPSRPTNAVMELTSAGLGGVGDVWTLPEFNDLHQIRWHDGLLWVVNARVPELIALDVARRAVVGGVALSDLVPAELRHDAPAERPTDIYHFNSLTFGGGRLWVLAHNWSHGAFAFEMEYRGAADLLRRPRLLRVHRGLGRRSHDLFHDAGRLFVLDSEGGRLLATGSEPFDVGKGSFPRGLAVSDRHLFVGSGEFSAARADRSSTASRLTVLDRKTLRSEAVLDLGRHGNTCDVLLLSHPDWTDRPEAARRRSALSLLGALWPWRKAG